MPGYQARLVDEQQAPVPAGVIGNLLIRRRFHMRRLLEQA